MDAIRQFQGQYWFLSNFYPVPGSRFTVEHEFQAAKAAHANERRWVLGAQSPGEAKRRGRRVVLRPDWEEIKVEVMRGFLKGKFSQPDLREKLLATGDALLEEGNDWGDIYWGTVNGRGRNMLGKLLMEVRRRLREPAECCGCICGRCGHQGGLSDHSEACQENMGQLFDLWAEKQQHG